MKRTIALWSALCLVSCQSASMTEPEDSGPDVRDAGPPELVTPPAFRHEMFFDELLSAADAFHYGEGEWHQDYGDASFFGLAFYSRLVESSPETPFRSYRDESHTRVAELVADANLVGGDLNEIAMGALGLTEYIGASGDSSDAEALTDLVRQMNDLARLLRYYLDGPAAAGFAQDLYGATSLSALVAILNVQHALHVGGETQQEMTDAAVAVIDAIDRFAWRETYYAKNRETDELYLYPNITMIAANARVFQLTRDRRYIDRARQTFEGIQSLRQTVDPPASARMGAARYRSPYLRDYMGLETDDVATLSAQNYLMLALLILFEATGETAYVEEVDALLDAISGDLFDTFCHSFLEDFQVCEPSCGETQACFIDQCEADRCGAGVLHHWIDGRIALESDGDMFCSGCNLQSLFIMQTRRTLEPAPLLRE